MNLFPPNSKKWTSDAECAGVHAVQYIHPSAKDTKDMERPNSPVHLNDK